MTSSSASPRHDASPAPVSMTRRAFLRRTLTTTAVAGAATTVAACGSDAPIPAWAHPFAPDFLRSRATPDPLLLDTVSALSALAAGRNGAEADFYMRQRDAVAGEILRECGADVEGNHPPECVDALDSVIGAPPGSTPELDGEPLANARMDVANAYIAALRQEDRASSVEVAAQSALLASLYAAFVVSMDSQSPIVGWTALSTWDLTRMTAAPAAIPGHGSAGSPANTTTPSPANPVPMPKSGFSFESLLPILDATHAALYASGVTLGIVATAQKSADAGAVQGAIVVTMRRLRVLRAQLQALLTQSGIEVPPAAPGYIPDRPVGDAATAVQMCHDALATVSGALIDTAGQAGCPAETREWVARWAGIIARGEAACERHLGQDPLERTSR